MPTSSSPDPSRAEPRSMCGCAAGTAAIVGLLVVILGTWLAVRVWKRAGGAPLDEGGRRASGWSAGWLGDLDGDGVTDLALLTGSERARGGLQDWGVVRVLSGATGKTLRTIEGVGAYVGLEEQIGPAGDVDGDGRPEIWWKDGEHELLVGKAGGERAHLRLEVGYHARVAPLGDVDGDHCTDLLVSRLPAELSGGYAVSAVSGRAGATLWTLTFPYTDSPTGWSREFQVERAGDCDGDGVEDAAFADDQERLLLVGGASGIVLRTLPLRVSFGGAFEPLGDLDGDGKPELLFCAGYPDRGDPGAPRHPVQVVSSVDGEVLASYPVGELALWNVFSPGDVDGDGHLDAAWQSGPTVEVVSALDGRHLLRVENASALPGRGDWNADGCADLLVTRNLYFDPDEEAPDELWRKGRVEVISGRDGSVLRAFDEGVLP